MPSNTNAMSDICALPDGQSSELIYGVIYDTAPPSRLHQEISVNLALTSGIFEGLEIRVSDYG